jgi:hypothetical protein
MDKPISPRRLAENEAFFRQKNQDIEKNFDLIKELAKAENQTHIVNDDDLVLRFFCECSDENCRERIPLHRSRYDGIHKANDLFVVVSGHEYTPIEKIVEKTDEYCVVRKKIQPPVRAAKLNPTPINNV